MYVSKFSVISTYCGKLTYIHTYIVTDFFIVYLVYVGLAHVPPNKFFWCHEYASGHCFYYVHLAADSQVYTFCRAGIQQTCYFPA